LQKFQKEFFKDIFAGSLAEKRGFPPTHAACGGELPGRAVAGVAVFRMNSSTVLR